MITFSFCKSYIKMEGGQNDGRFQIRQLFRDVDQHEFDQCLMAMVFISIFNSISGFC